MKEVFELAEKMENKISALQTKDFINDFILYSYDYLNNEKRNEKVEGVLEPIPILYAEWDDALRKLLGLNIKPADKKDVFLHLEKRIEIFEEKNNVATLTELINSTPYSLIKGKMYEAGCNKYITTISKLVITYRNIFNDNYNALNVNTTYTTKESGSSERVKNEPDLLSRIHQDNKEYFKNICQALCKSENFKELVSYNADDDTYTWNIEKWGSILKFVAFSQAIKDRQITLQFNSSAHRCRAFCKYFNVERDIEKQFGDNELKKCKKFMPPFIDIINNVIKGNKLRED